MRSVSFGSGGLRRGPTGGAAADFTHVLPHSHAVGYQGLALGRDLCHLAVFGGLLPGFYFGNMERVQAAELQCKLQVATLMDYIEDDASCRSLARLPRRWRMKGCTRRAAFGLWPRSIL